MIPILIVSELITNFNVFILIHELAKYYPDFIDGDLRETCPRLHKESVGDVQFLAAWTF